MNDSTRRELAETDALRTKVDNLQDEVDSLAQQIEAIADYDGIAATGAAAWTVLKSIDLVIHEFLVHDHANPDPLTPDPVEGIRESLSASFAQLKRVMDEEYDIEIGKKRLRVAAAFARQVLEALNRQIDVLVTHSRDRQREVRSEVERGWFGGP